MLTRSLAKLFVHVFTLSLETFTLSMLLKSHASHSNGLKSLLKVVLTYSYSYSILKISWNYIAFISVYLIHVFFSSVWDCNETSLYCLFKAHIYANVINIVEFRFLASVYISFICREYTTLYFSCMTQMTSVLQQNNNYKCSMAPYAFAHEI